MTRRSGGGSSWLRCCLVVFAVISALCVCGPALYWRFKKGLLLKGNSSASSSCSPCIYCGKDDPDLKEEMEKQFVDLLTEELKLQEIVGQDHIHHMNITFGEAKRLASQYRVEAEKCNTATETCESARERAEALMRKERKGTNLWEQRARQLGWEGE